MLYVPTLKNILVASLNPRQGPRLLGYDLDLLHDYVQRKGTKKLVLALRDSEAFDPGLLTDLLSLFKCDPLPPLAKISTYLQLDHGSIVYHLPFS